MKAFIPLREFTVDLENRNWRYRGVGTGRLMTRPIVVINNSLALVDGDRFCFLRPKFERERIIRELYTNNTSGHNGVSFKTERQSWFAYINVRGKHVNSGYYATKEEAIEIRKLMELGLYVKQQRDVGVLFSKRHQLWYAEIQANKRRRMRGYFSTKIEAISARKYLEMKYDAAPTIP